VVEAREQAEGAGARVRRSIGTAKLRNLDPFLMLGELTFLPIAAANCNLTLSLMMPDEFFVKKPAGFPDHPHRGFETVTYMLEGSFQHEDFCGHKGTIGPGDLQWMTAGRGIMHCEMPASDGVNHGLQLWVNLKAKDKMTKPAYQELLNKEIPKVEKDGVHATVIAGEALGTKSPVYTRTPTYYIDFRLKPDAVLHQAIPEGWTSFAYTLEGSGQFGPDSEKNETVDAHCTVVFSANKEEQGITVKGGKDGLRFVLLAGEPLNEPIYQHGPFVMNKASEIDQAMKDYMLGM
ncbi:unnamed protein product, partial [Symbiodinium sp. KB8]